ncbi:MAG: helix-turn-helix domain-containing protein [Methylocystis sp.]|nr:helix-turn-helix domain-containing protein [Methylocystis sp.]
MPAIAHARAEGLTIGDVSRRTGVHIETIRYYEKIGILPAPPRSDSGRRIYGQSQTRTLAFIRRARELGFTLNEIRKLLDLSGPGKSSCAEVREIAAIHLDSVRAKLADLARLEAILATTIAQCAGRTTPACPVLDMLDAPSRTRETSP